MLDEAGFTDAKIVISNSLDEYTIKSILDQGGQVDSFGVGERLITSRSEPVFGAVFKLCAVEENGKFSPRIKISDSVEKITNPGLKDVYRIYDRQGHAIADLITGHGEDVDVERSYRFVDPIEPWKVREFSDCTKKSLQQKVIENGRLIRTLPAVKDIQKYVREQLDNEIWPEEQRFENPHRHYVDMSPKYYEMKMDMLANAGQVHK